MVKIPEHKLSSSSLELARANPELASAGGQMLEDAGKGLGSIAEHFEKLHDDSQSNKAEIALYDKLDKKHIELMQSDNPHKARLSLDGEVDSIINETSSMIDTPNPKEQWKQSASLMAERWKTTISSQLMNRELELGKSNLLGLEDSLAKQYILTGDQDKAMIKAKMAEIMQRGIGNHYIHPEVGREYLKSLFDKLPVDVVDSDIGLALSSDDPVGTTENIISELEKGNKGRYKDIPEGKEKLAMLEKAISARTLANKLVQEKTRNINHIADKQATFDYASGTLTQDWLIQHENTMTKKRYDLLTNNLRNKNMATQSNPYDFMEMIDFMSENLKTNDENSERDVTNKLIQMENDKRLTPDEAHDLVKMFMIPPDKDPVFKLPQRPTLEQYLTAQEQKNNMSTNKRTWIDAAFTMIKSYATGQGTSDKQQADLLKLLPAWFTKNYTNQPMTDPSEIVGGAKEIINNDIKTRHPETNMLEDTPNSVMSAKEGLKDVWNAPSKNKVDYTIKDGKVVPTKVKKTRNAGDMVMYKGEKHRINKILPDGSYELEDKAE